MDWSIEIKTEGDVLIATVTGDLNENDYRAARDRVRSYLEETGLYRVLFDIRNAVLHVSTMGIFSVAASYSKVIPLGTLYAVVYSSQTLPPSDASFGENVAQNRGTCLRSFVDITKARQWFTVESSTAMSSNKQG